MPQKTTIKFEIKLTRSQKEVHKVINNPTTKLKYFTLNWSRQSGKSTLMKVLCLEWLFKKKVHIGYVCKNYILAKKLYKDLALLIPKMFVKSANGTDLIIETTFGSSLQFFSAESGSSLRGLTFDYLICDEFAFFNFEQTDGTHLWYDILYPTIKVKGKKVIFVSTPLGKNNIFYEMYQKGRNPKNVRYYSTTRTIYEDGLVTPAEVEEIKNSIPDITFQQEFLCRFLDSSLTFFKNFENCFKEIPKSYQKTWIGIDLSAAGSDNTILTKINEKNECEVFEIRGSLSDKYVEIARLINQSRNLQGVYIEQNGIGTPMIEEILKHVTPKSLVHPWLTTNNTKEDIIGNLAVTIEKEEITFDKNDLKLFDELGSFVCKPTKTGKLQFEAQNGKKDDRVMSVAMAFQCKNDYKYDKNIYFNKRISSKNFI